MKLLSLVFELTRNSTSFMLQLVQMKAIGLIGYLLERVCYVCHRFPHQWQLRIVCCDPIQVSPQHLCTELVSCIFDFARYIDQSGNKKSLCTPISYHSSWTCRYLSETPNGCELLLQFLECLIFNAGLWSKAEQKVQRCSNSSQ